MAREPQKPKNPRQKPGQKPRQKPKHEPITSFTVNSPTVVRGHGLHAEIKYLTSPTAISVIKAKGMEPG
jgi:hypothetical protein